MGLFGDAMQALYHSGHYRYAIIIKKTAPAIDPKTVPAIMALGQLNRTPNFKTWEFDSPFKVAEFTQKLTAAIATCPLEMTDVTIKPEMDGRWGDR
ncbi:hypothetical protein C5Z25_07910 [Lactobacillus sp. CBA3605]|uniref:hypothetical protein n=1 Tax=Lactobacillus sp. CBA3605 TaxID=2099788 RepID=UPI000CFDD16E|nr:hypothetical protein [Lactobacillus sp. CBA3605]AVK61704.1 hypothetical protein C5Z25_07910 [Lactobacillus sp. CBA3605]